MAQTRPPSQGIDLTQPRRPLEAELVMMILALIGFDGLMRELYHVFEEAEFSMSGAQAAQIERMAQRMMPQPRRLEQIDATRIAGWVRIVEQLARRADPASIFVPAQSLDDEQAERFRTRYERNNSPDTPTNRNPWERLGRMTRERLDDALRQRREVVLPTYQAQVAIPRTYEEFFDVRPTVEPNTAVEDVQHPGEWYDAIPVADRIPALRPPTPPEGEDR